MERYLRTVKKSSTAVKRKVELPTAPHKKKPKAEIAGQRKAETQDKLTARRRIIAEPPTDAELKLLQDFDLRTKYGAAVGISRLVRWRRADRLGLNPPTAVKKILERHNQSEKVLTSVLDTTLKETGRGLVSKVQLPR